jgi:nitroimidazol reductase NimA-like FMN-containing flavoprotein (pyridoxamine 5'-phosphate oxidase superfamily)
VPQQATVRRIRRSVFGRGAPRRAGTSRWVLCRVTSGRCALGSSAMTADDSPVDEIASAGLSRTECLALLATTEFGHLTLTRRALPTVVPAHYALHEDRVVIHAAMGGDPDLWRDGEIVALHVDAFDTDRRAGWSVSVTGAAQEQRTWSEPETSRVRPGCPAAPETSSPSPPTSYGANTSERSETRSAITKKSGHVALATGRR